MALSYKLNDRPVSVNILPSPSLPKLVKNSSPLAGDKLSGAIIVITEYRYRNRGADKGCTRMTRNIHLTETGRVAKVENAKNKKSLRLVLRNVEHK